ncbi:hypothetical protein EVAR_95948_1 [Eumeta japonica]|uniref:Uncharacterized protein n=1 Tax=Eumeta variegata TaxID=151549 RepID=A0A4C1VAB1_EUMVA|nr:hypothetical protein EVAR_95948_1 [Eumeta japonica]
MDTRNLKEGTSALTAFWAGTGYLMEGSWLMEEEWATGTSFSGQNATSAAITSHLFCQWLCSCEHRMKSFISIDPFANHDSDVVTFFDFSLCSAFDSDSGLDLDSSSVQNTHKLPAAPLASTYKEFFFSFISQKDAYS